MSPGEATSWQGALEDFGLEVTGLRCLDAGAGSGGFTDCLLSRGAAHVVAVDVGYGQFDWKLRNDPRVEPARADEPAVTWLPSRGDST